MTTEDRTRALTALLEEATQSIEGTLDVERELNAVEGWDSMGMVMFLGLVKQEFGEEVPVQDVRECTTALDLFALVQTRIAQRGSR